MDKTLPLGVDIHLAAMGDARARIFLIWLIGYNTLHYCESITTLINGIIGLSMTLCVYKRARFLS